MKRKILSILMLCLICLLFGCSEKETVTLSLIEESLPSQFSLSTVYEEMTYVNFNCKTKNSERVVDVKLEYFSEEDLNKLSTVGTHELTLNYLSGSLKFSVTVADLYTVKLVYGPGDSGVMGASIQWCSGENCFLPQKTNEAGIAKIDLEDGEYYIHVLSGIPERFTYNPNIYTTDKNNKLVIIELDLLEPLVGEGTLESPYELSRGVYGVEFSEGSTSGMKYFEFTPGQNTTYRISSRAMDKLAINKIDPYLGFLGTTKDMNNIDVSGNKDSNNINFSFEFEGEAGRTLYFVIMVSSADSYPAYFEIEIE